MRSMVIASVWKTSGNPPSGRTRRLPSGCERHKIRSQLDVRRRSAIGVST
jgi:hypothetical protein